MSRRKTAAVSHVTQYEGRYYIVTPHDIVTAKWYCYVRQDLIELLCLPLSEAQAHLLEMPRAERTELLRPTTLPKVPYPAWLMRDNYEYNYECCTTISQRQRLGAHWRALLDWLAAQESDEHATEVVEAVSCTSEDVHGGDEVARDIVDAPPREVAGQDGQENDGKGAGEQPRQTSDADGGQQGDGVGQDGAENTGTGGQQDSEVGAGDATNGGAGSSDKNGVDDAIDHFLARFTEAHNRQMNGGGVGGDGGHRAQAGHIDPSLFYAMRRVITMLADAPDALAYQDGDALWNAQMVARARFAPHTLPQARHAEETTHDNLFLIVDDSGSVSELAHVFTSLAASAAGLIRVFAGSEAHPCEEWTLPAPLKSPYAPLTWQVRWQQEYQRDFCANVRTWLAYARPQPGARLIFWGDAIDMHLADAAELRVLLRAYRPVWLMSHAGHNRYHGYEGRTVERAMRVRYNVDEAAALLAACKQV
jgi:hypothetical protein